jgi:glycosyltransferase involved in cell wall biosynthesis
MSRGQGAPLVSVVMPTYNCARYIGDAVESVLAQDFKDRELIVIDDGSSDGTDQVLRKFGSQLRYMQQKNRGEPAARNAAIRAAHGKYIAFLDADDLWLPGELGVQVEFLEKRPDVGMTFTDALLFDQQKVLCHSWTAQRDGFKAGQALAPGGTLAGWFYRELAMQNFITVSSTVFRRSAYDVVGPFEETYLTGTDHHYWLRLAARYPIGYIHRVLVKKLVRPEGLIEENFERSYLNEIRLLQEAATWPGHFEKVGRREWRRRLGELNGRLAWRYFHIGELARARSRFLTSLAWWPWRAHPYLYLPFTFLPPGGLRALRGAKGWLRRAGGGAQASAAKP